MAKLTSDEALGIVTQAISRGILLTNYTMREKLLLLSLVAHAKLPDVASAEVAEWMRTTPRQVRRVLRQLKSALQQESAEQ